MIQCVRCFTPMVKSVRHDDEYNCPTCNLKLLHVETQVEVREPTEQELDERFYEAQGALD